MPADLRAGPNSPTLIRRVVVLARRGVIAGSLGLIAVGVVGQTVRDRSAAWAVLMYLPLPLLGPGVVGLDLLLRGRALGGGRRRFALAGLGLATGIGSALPLVARGLDGARPPGGDELAPGHASAPLAVLHWNVIWGGGRQRNPAHWAAIRRTIADQAADVIVLSEAPPDDRLDELVADLGPRGGRVQVEHEPGSPYWYKLVVASARPLRLVRREAVRNGAAMVVEVQVRPDGGGGAGDRLRLLVVDGQSHPFQSRAPFLADVAAACGRAEAEGAPIDLVVGDFRIAEESTSRGR